MRWWGRRNAAEPSEDHICLGFESENKVFWLHLSLCLLVCVQCACPCNQAKLCVHVVMILHYVHACVCVISPFGGCTVCHSCVCVCVCVADKWSQPSGSRVTEIWSCLENTCRTWLCVGILQDCDHQILNHNYTETPLGGPLICVLTDTDIQKMSRQAACLNEDEKENTYNRHTVSENNMLSRVRYALWSFISISAQVGMDYSTFLHSYLLALGQYTPIKS